MIATLVAFSIGMLGVATYAIAQRDGATAVAAISAGAAAVAYLGKEHRRRLS